MNQSINRDKFSQPGAIPFTKMVGAGNDFIIIDIRSADVTQGLDRKALAVSLCRRHFSVGADGLVLIEKAQTSGTHFKWDFYNSDGSKAEYCGNAARCVARFAFTQKIAGKEISFDTEAGVTHARILPNGQVEVEMPQPKVLNKSVEIPLSNGTRVQAVLLNTGVPHVVTEITDWDDETMFELGAYLRRHPFFKSTNGANVTFYELTGEAHVQAATYERGVEDITLACGTGVIAAALAAMILKGAKSPVTVEMPGGALKAQISSDFSQALLTGDAHFVCRGEVLPDALL